MENWIITVDGGTTNTRACLWKGETLAAQASREVGVRCTAVDGNNARLKAAVRDCIREVLTSAGANEEEVGAILASGMISSNVGLAEVPHCMAPAGAAELAAAAKQVTIPEIVSLPITIIPGVKNPVSPVDLTSFGGMDMMRGEEVETLALLEAYPKGRPYLLVLPGSHMKFVSVDRQGRIVSCLTSISGELLSAITNDTIIADAVGKGFVTDDSYDPDFVALGAREAASVGLGRACFSARILSQFPKTPPEKLANFLLGAVLQGDLTALRGAKWLQVETDAEVIVAGKGPLRRAMAQLLAADGIFSDVHMYDGEGKPPLSALGARAVGKLLGVC